MTVRPLSKQDIELILKTHFDQAEVHTVSELEDTTYRECVDGRSTAAILGMVGGDMGALVIKATALEAVLDRTLTETELNTLFDLQLQKYGTFYMHTDTHALLHGLEAMETHIDSSNTAQAEAFTAFKAKLETLTQNPDLEEDQLAIELKQLIIEAKPPLQSILLKVLAEQGNIGCGHLNLLVKHAAEYGVRAELVQHLIRRFYKQLWTQPDTLEYRVLPGEHEEKLVVRLFLVDENNVELVLSSDTKVASIPPRVDVDSPTQAQKTHDEIFVDDPTLIEYLLKQRVIELSDDLDWLDLNDDQQVALREKAVELYGLHTVTTVQKLAPTLPIVAVLVKVDEDETVSYTMKDDESSTT